MKKFSFKRLARMALVMTVLVMTLSQPALAYKLYTIQCTIDDSSWQILAGVVMEKTGITGVANEVSRIGADNLEKLANNRGSTLVGADLLAGALPTSKFGGTENGKNRVLSFPGAETGIQKDSTEKDQFRAVTIKDVLVNDLNVAYSFIYEGKTSSIAEYKANMVSLLRAVGGAGSISGFTFSHGTDITKFPDSSLTSDCYVTISNGTNTISVAYKMPKGYGAHNDAEYLTWGEIAYEAFANYAQEEKVAITSENVYSSEPGSLEKALVDLLNSLINWLSGALGLWGLDELILNDGLHGSSFYIGGVFPASWERVIWTFFTVSEVIVLLVLSYAILSGIYKKAASTVNPTIRASFMDQIQRTLIAIFAIILLPVIFRLIFSLTATFTSIFASALGDKTAAERLLVYSKSSGTIGGCVTQIVYFGALLYFNFYYYLRALLMAALILLSPICVMFYCISEEKKQVTKDWLGMVTGTLLIQPIHALVLTLILLLPTDGRMFTTIIGIYAMIPLSNSLLSVLVRNGNSVLHGAAGAGQHATQKALKVGATAALGTAAFVGGSAIAGASARWGKTPSGSQSSGSTEAQTGVPGQSSRSRNAEQAAQTRGKAEAYSTNGQQEGRREAAQTHTKSFDGQTGEPVNTGESHFGGGAGRVPSGGKTFGAGAGVPHETSDNTETKVSGARQWSESKAGVRAKNVMRTAVGGVGVLGLSAAGASLNSLGIRNGLGRTARNLAVSTGTKNRAGMEQYAARTEAMDRASMRAAAVDIGSRAVAGENVQGDLAGLMTENQAPYPNANFTFDGSNFAATRKDLAKAGMSVKEGDDKKTTYVTYDAEKMHPHDIAQLETASGIFESGTPEQKAELRDRGIASARKEWTVTPDGKKGDVASYQLEVSDVQKFRQNYGINLRDQRGATNEYRVTMRAANSMAPQVVEPLELKKPTGIPGTKGKE